MTQTSEQIEKKIGPYRLIRLIAKGGMGEVFLAYDPDCRREIALKCIRSEYLNHPVIFKRFVKEAFIASHLTHPNIIPIYSLSKDQQRPYYTMPFIEGKTLKKVLIETLEQENQPQYGAGSIGSIESLTHIFLTLCQAVAYAHSQQIVHRDLKPENILIGKYGEVLIFDWGVADKIQNIAQEDPSYTLEELEFPNLTSPGKIIGTLSFLAPERFKGEPADYQTDIYSLGVMLYTILTLKHPFKRKNLQEIKKTIDREVLKNPIEVAPYRDIPHALVNITQKCLAPDRNLRYKNMDELLSDLKNFVKGNSEWLKKESLIFSKNKDWGFHENILVSKHQAITQKPDAFEWVSLMLSQKNFGTQIRIETKITLKEGSLGIGLLINGAKTPSKFCVTEGYDIWLSTHPQKVSQLSRNNIAILTLPHLLLKPEIEYKIVFQQIGNRVQLEVNGAQQFSYLSYLGLQGKQVGLFYRDTLFEIKPLDVYVASPSLIVSCLDVPDAFFEHENFDQAYTEYRRIAKAFPGRHESREAFFRAGLSKLHKGTLPENQQYSALIFDEALSEFESLKRTPGAPLEYLGKALVYHAENSLSEELKCLELCMLKYPKHPLLYLIYEHILYRMYESSNVNRIATYEFILLALRYNAYAEKKQMIDFLLLNLSERKGMYFFFIKLPEKATDKDQLYRISINISFFLGKTHLLIEHLNRCIFLKQNAETAEKIESEEPNSSSLSHSSMTEINALIQNILLALWFLGKKELLIDYLKGTDPHTRTLFSLLDEPSSEQNFLNFLKKTPATLSPLEENILFILIDKALLDENHDALSSLFNHLTKEKNLLTQSESLEKLQLEYFLITRKLKAAATLVEKNKKLFETLHLDQRFLEGCYLNGTRGAQNASEFFSQELETSIPELSALGALYLTDRLDIEVWSKTAFQFEIITFYRQIYIYYRAGNNLKKASQYLAKWKAHSYYS